MFKLVERSRRVLDRAARALARPTARAARRGEIVVQPYRGYGFNRDIFLMGRVFHEQPPTAGSKDGLGQKFAALWRLMRRWGIADAHLIARFGNAEHEVRTDQDGYFEVRLQAEPPTPGDNNWHQVSLTLAKPTRIETAGDVFIPPPSCRFVVISDIDDTVMHTGVANKLLMMWRLFVQGAGSRVAFPGMAAFLRALHGGAGGHDSNPLLYVSRAPWSIYGVLEAFFQQHDIPVGPILFLREWGITLQSPLPRRGKGHKLKLIREILSLYADLPFVLIGDSGQRDPEIYASIVHDNPGRALAVYIRKVGADRDRDRAIETLSAEIAAAGGSLVLAADTMVMARHAAAQGLIDEQVLDDLYAEKSMGSPVADIQGMSPVPLTDDGRDGSNRTD